MKVSIITVCFNAQDTIEETIQSVVSQTYGDVEYLIVDGGSNDSTVEIAQKYLNEGVSKVFSEKDEGIYDGMNKGINLATGDLIGILNADDFYSDDKVISDVVKKITRDNAQSIYADLDYVDPVETNNVKRKWRSGNYKRSNFLRGWMPPHPTFFIRKSCYTKFGLFLTSMKSAADYELMLRMLYKNKISTTYLPRTIIKMRVGGVSNNSIKNRINANKEDRKAWEINGIKPKWYTLGLKPISKIAQFLK
ncbi:MAG: glycosyltransferase family 2 protein [Salibacteraceae bacterium]